MIVECTITDVRHLSKCGAWEWNRGLWLRRISSFVGDYISTIRLDVVAGYPCGSILIDSLDDADKKESKNENGKRRHIDLYIY